MPLAARSGSSAHGQAAVYQCLAPPDAVLAVFGTATEGFEVIVDPMKINDVRLYVS
jgi:hypothetical protein